MVCVPHTIVYSTELHNIARVYLCKNNRSNIAVPRVCYIKARLDLQNLSIHYQIFLYIDAQESHSLQAIFYLLRRYKLKHIN